MVKYLRAPEVREVTGLSDTTIWRKEQRGEFPRRRRISGNIVGWRSDEIEEWVESRPTVELGSSS